MSKKMMRSVLAVLVALMMLVVFVACDNPADTTTTPDTTDIPETTIPEDTTPEDTTPEDTTPEDTTPEDTTPDETLPEDTTPDETLPDETKPAETEPEETQPAETQKPAETEKPAGPHKHVYNKSGGVATCEVDGTILYTCVCGDMYEEKGEPAYGHTWVLVEEITPATCTSEGFGKWHCDFCGWDSTHAIPMLPHDLSVSTALVSAADDEIYGRGYEYLACSMCNYMEKVVANHSFGHFFTENADGTITCGCGVTGEDVTQLGAMQNDYNDDTATTYNQLPFGSSVKENGKWRVSAHNGQSAYFATAAVKGMLGGSYDGDVVVDVTLSFKLSYTGTVPAVYGGNFLAWRNDGLNGAAYTEEFSLNLTKSGEKLVLSRGDKTVTMDADKDYIVTIKIDPVNNTAQMYIDAEGMTRVEFLPATKMKNTSNSLWAIYVSRAQFYHANAEEFALWIDDVSLDYMARNVLGEPNTDACDHVFTTESYVDEDHYLFEQWTRETCEVCGRYYFNQECEALGGHRYGETPIETTIGNCTTPGTETYVCEVCGFHNVVELKTKHELLHYAGTVSAADDLKGKGYELWACDCGYTQKVNGNHESGHTFVEQPSGNELCNCGAINGVSSSVYAQHDFTSVDSGNITFVGMSADKITANGELSLKGVGRYVVSTAGMEALTGELDGLEVKTINFTADFRYTGTFTMPATGGGYYMQVYGKNAANENKTHYVLEVAEESGKLVLKRSIRVTLEPDTTYKFRLEFLPATNNVNFYIDDAKVYSGDTRNVISTITQFDFGHPGYAGLDAVIDNAKFTAEVLGLNESEMLEACEHEFVEEPFQDYHHPAHEMWFRETCTKCGIYIEKQDCGYIGHDWTEEPVDGDIGNCLTSSYSVYQCRNCGELKTVTADKGPHSLVSFVSVTPTEGDVKGYETWYCEICEKNIDLEGNHDSGHTFKGITKVCDCGARGETVTVVKNILSESHVSSYNSQPSWDYSHAAWSGTYNDEPVDHVRLSFDFRYTGTPSACGTSAKADTLMSFRLAGGDQVFNVRADLSGEKLVLMNSSDWEKTMTLDPGKKYTLIFEADLKNDLLTVSIGAADGGEVVVLGTATRTNFQDAWRFYFRTMNVGYTADATVFAMYISDWNVSVVDYTVDTTNMVEPIPAE